MERITKSGVQWLIVYELAIFALNAYYTIIDVPLIIPLVKGGGIGLAAYFLYCYAVKLTREYLDYLMLVSLVTSTPSKDKISTLDFNEINHALKGMITSLAIIAIWIAI